MKKTGILYDNISGNTGDVAIGISLKKILRQLNVEFDELIPGNFNPLEYETIIIGGGHLLRQSPDFFNDKFRVPGNHILNAMGICGEPKDLDYLRAYRYITVRSNGDKRKLSYLNKDIHVVPCTTMLLEDILELPFTFKKPCIGMHIFPVFSKEEEDQFIHWVSSLPFTVYFVPITHHNKDIQYMRYLKEKIPNSEVLPILKAQEIFTIIGKFKYFISCSLHGAIFAYVHNIPFALLNLEDKMGFFMEDRNLEQYLFKNFYELKFVFEDLIKNHPDYIKKISIDKKILQDYVNYLKTVLPVGKCEEIRNNDIESQSKYQINYLLSDISELERKISLNSSILKEMNITIQSLEEIINEKDHHTKEVEDYIKSLKQALLDKEEHIQNLDEYIQSLKGIISEKDLHHKQVEAYNRSFEQAFLDKEEHIQNLDEYIQSLKGIISEKDLHHKQVEAYSRSFEQAFLDKEEHIQNLDGYIESLMATIRANEQQCKKIEENARYAIIAQNNRIKRLNCHSKSLEKQLSYFIKK